MESNTNATLSMIEDLLEEAQSDRPNDLLFEAPSCTKEVDAEFVLPMADAVLA